MCVCGGVARGEGVKGVNSKMLTRSPVNLHSFCVFIIIFLFIGIFQNLYMCTGVHLDGLIALNCLFNF